MCQPKRHWPRQGRGQAPKDPWGAHMAAAHPTDLQCDPVLHQEPNLDVHQVEVLLQLLVGPNLGHHLFSQPCHLQLLLEVQVTLV